MDLPGRPLAYRTTSVFLRCFGLESIDDLPPVLPGPGEGEEAKSESSDLEGQIGFETDEYDEEKLPGDPPDQLRWQEEEDDPVAVGEAE